MSRLEPHHHGKHFRADSGDCVLTTKLILTVGFTLMSSIRLRKFFLLLGCLQFLPWWTLNFTDCCLSLLLYLYSFSLYFVQVAIYLDCVSNVKPTLHSGNVSFWEETLLGSWCLTLSICGRIFFLYSFICAYIFWVVSPPPAPPLPLHLPLLPGRTCSALFSKFVEEKT
jgi:hypothetical protein